VTSIRLVGRADFWFFFGHSSGYDAGMLHAIRYRYGCGTMTSWICAAWVYGAAMGYVRLFQVNADHVWQRRRFDQHRAAGSVPSPCGRWGFLDGRADAAANPDRCR